MWCLWGWTAKRCLKIVYIWTTSEELITIQKDGNGSQVFFPEHSANSVCFGRDLQANPLQGDLVNTFHGFTQLQTLWVRVWVGREPKRGSAMNSAYWSEFGLHIMTACVVFRILPQDVNCPGGINACDTITFYINNQSCEGQRNICNSTETQVCCLTCTLWKLPLLPVFSTLDRKDGKVPFAQVSEVFSSVWALSR